MQRRSFFERLFGAALAGVAMRRVDTAAAELSSVDGYQPLPPGLTGNYRPMVGGRYAPDQPMFSECSCFICVRGWPS